MLGAASHTQCVVSAHELPSLNHFVHACNVSCCNNGPGGLLARLFQSCPANTATVTLFLRTTKHSHDLPLPFCSHLADAHTGWVHSQRRIGASAHYRNPAAVPPPRCACPHAERSICDTLDYTDAAATHCLVVKSFVPHTSQLHLFIVHVQYLALCTQCVNTLSWMLPLACLDCRCF